MRLSDSEKSAIVQTAQSIFGENVHVWLFGSRIDNKKRGGDIDIYVECHLPQGIALAKAQFLTRLFQTLGEQKIDVLVQSLEKPQHPLGKIAKAEGIKLL